MSKPFEPSRWRTQHMIDAAMSAFDRDREGALRDRAESAFAHNARERAASRAGDERRRRRAGGA